MRRIVFILFVLALAAPVLALAANRGFGDGTLSVADARGVVLIRARGGVIGQVDRGQVTITDLNPADDAEPIVSGDDSSRILGAATVYSGRDVRFRIVGGAFRILVRGAGIDLSAVGTGLVLLQGDVRSPGVFSFTEDCGAAPEDCDELPLRPTRYRLGGERLRGEKTQRGA